MPRGKSSVGQAAAPSTPFYRTVDAAAPAILSSSVSRGKLAGRRVQAVSSDASLPEITSAAWSASCRQEPAALAPAAGHPRERYFGSLQQACDGALAADDPMAAFRTTIDELLSEEAAPVAVSWTLDEGRAALWREVVVQIRHLLAACSARPEETATPFISFLHALSAGLRTGQMGLLAVRALVAQLLYIADRGALATLGGALDTIGAAAQQTAERLLRSHKQAAEAQIATYLAADCYQKEDVRSTLFPRAVAEVIVCQDGTLNLGLIPLVKTVFLRPKAERDGVEQQIATTLTELQSDQALVAAVEAATPPTDPDTVGDVNCLLGRPLTAPVSRPETVHAILTTLCTWNRQTHLGNCYLLVPRAIRREALAGWMVQDFQELLANRRRVIRIIDGKPVVGEGLPWFHHEAVVRAVPVAACGALFDLPSVRQALELLCCTTAEGFRQAAQQAASCQGRKASFTLLTVFENLCRHHGLPAAHLTLAIEIVESLSQNPLLRIWENAMGGLMFPPLSSSHLPIHMIFPRKYTKALVDISISLAKKRGLHGAGAQLAEVADRCDACPEGPQVLADNAIPPLWSTLRPCHVPLTHEGSDSLAFAMMREDPQSHDLVPFHSEEEFQAFIIQAFDEWVDSRPSEDMVPPSQKRGRVLRMDKNPEDFGTLIHEGEEVAVDAGSFNGVLYHPIGGGDLLNFLGEQTVQISGGDMVKFGTSLDKAIPRFFAWMDGIRHSCGNDPSLAINTAGASHSFRLLPNHPSVVEWQEQGKEVVAEVPRRTAARCSYTKTVAEQLQAVQAVIASVAQEIAETIAQKRPPSGQMLARQIVTATERTVTANGRLPIKEFCQAAAAAVETVYTAYHHKPLPETEKTAVHYALLETIDPALTALPIHFADTNWVIDDAGDSRAVHYALWWNPCVERWMTISIPDSGTIVLKRTKRLFSPVVEPASFFSIMHVQPIAQPVLQQIRAKTCLRERRKIVKRALHEEQNVTKACAAMKQEPQ